MWLPTLPKPWMAKRVPFIGRPHVPEDLAADVEQPAPGGRLAALGAVEIQRLARHHRRRVAVVAASTGP